jgi:glycosyltransferase involved in cell wall biosynthesis
MAQGLAELGWDVHTLIPGDPHSLDVELDHCSLPYTVIPRVRWWDTSPVEQAHDPQALESLLRRLRPDVTLTQSAVVPQLAIAARGLNIPHVWYLHEFGDIDHDLVLPSTPRQWGEFVKGHSEAVLANSTAVRNHFFDEAAHVDVVPYSIHLPQRGLLTTHVGHRIGVVATLHPGKGQELAIRAVSQLLGTIPDATLHLFGSGAPREVLRLKRLVSEMSLDSTVVFHGFVADRNAIYRDLDAVLILSRAEAYGRVADEAAFVGLPTVFLSTGGLAERLRHGRDGLEVTSPNPALVASALAAVLTSEDLRSSLVAGARQRLEAQNDACPAPIRVNAALQSLLAS